MDELKDKETRADELKQQLRDKMEAIDQIESTCKKTTAEYYLKW